MPRTARALPLLYPIFFASGAAALIFETLWFRQTGLAFGTSVWASALVLSSFMAGLGLGNGLAARYGDRIQRPVTFYGLLELVVACVGFALVVFLPRATALVSRALEPFAGSSWLLQVARFGFAFALLAAPATAMGATLPTLVKALSGTGRDFGGLLGRLYGTNTLGAVAGAATAELVWIPHLGILGSGAFAAGLLLFAALLALVLGRHVESRASMQRGGDTRGGSLRFRASALLAASFLCGAILLGLEILWFRLLVMFMPHTSEVFAWMLAVVLAGIGLGGLLAALLLRFRADAAAAASIALLSGAATLYTYGIFPELANETLLEPISALPLCALLMLPTSLLSGVLFALLGKQLHRELRSEIRSAGLLTFANTVGSMLGPLAAGFVLLPTLGLESSIFVLSLAYAGVAVCVLASDPRVWPRRPAALATAAIVFGWLAFQFPFGQTSGLYARELTRSNPSERLVAVREGVTETVAYLRSEFMGEPRYYRLVTDGYSMSGTTLWSRRYMSLFAVLPLAFHPAPRHALLISYGVGITAKALTDQSEYERIDVVDISQTVLEMSQIVFAPEESPLRDPRVRVYIEDGRHFLQMTKHRYDLITAEPPPPAVARVVNLYTREYFELLASRLRKGGIATYWLPIQQLQPIEAKAITSAFCAAFPDCSLWEGAPGDWILLGTREAPGSLLESQIRRQWADPRLAPALRDIGVERPEQLAALFLADATFLESWVNGVLPLVDNWPHRAPRWGSAFAQGFPLEYTEILDTSASRRRFGESAFLSRMWPTSFREESLPFFDYQPIARAQLLRPFHMSPIRTLHRVLTETPLETLPLWMVGSDADKQRIVARVAGRGQRGEQIDYERALGALARRDYATAARLLREVPDSQAFRMRSAYRLYALCMAGHVDVAQREAREFEISMSGNLTLAAYWAFMKQRFGLEPPRPDAL